RRRQGGRGLLQRSGQVRDVPLGHGGPRGHRVQVRGPLRPAGPHRDAARAAPAAAPAGTERDAALPRADRDQGDGHVALRRVVHGPADARHRLRGDRVRPRDAAAADLAPQWRAARGHDHGPAPGARGHGAPVDGRRHPRHDGLPRDAEGPRGREGEREPEMKKMKTNPVVLVLGLLLVPALQAADRAHGLDPALLTRLPTDSWPTYHGDYSGRRYSTLSQINADNVKSLTLAWVYRVQ